MGFEVNHSKLMQLGMEWAEHLHFDGTNEFLLELSTRAGKPDFEIYERTIFELQGMGYQVIIAHPERYRAVQKDVSVAERLVGYGLASCRLRLIYCRRAFWSREKAGAAPVRSEPVQLHRERCP